MPELLYALSVLICPARPALGTAKTEEGGGGGLTPRMLFVLCRPSVFLLKQDLFFLYKIEKVSFQRENCFYKHLNLPTIYELHFLLYISDEAVVKAKVYTLIDVVFHSLSRSHKDVCLFLLGFCTHTI